MNQETREPETNGSGINPKKVGIFLGLVFILYFLTMGNQESAGLVRDVLGSVGDAIGKLCAYIRMLVG